MKNHPIWYLIIGIIVLLVPTIIYLCFLIPKLSVEYNVLMASGGVIATGGFYGASLIPEKVKYGALYKTAATSFTVLTVITLIEKFIMQIVGLVAVFVISWIIFEILKGVWKNARRRKENAEIAEQVARNIDKNS